MAEDCEGLSISLSLESFLFHSRCSVMVGRGHLLVPHGRLGDVVGRIVALGSAVTAANAWLLEFLLIAAFIALIMAELCSSSAALGPTIFVLMLFGGVSTTMTTMPSKSVIARVFGSSLALFDFQGLQSLLGFDQIEKLTPQGPLIFAVCDSIACWLCRYLYFWFGGEWHLHLCAVFFIAGSSDRCAWRHLQGFYCQQPLKASSHVIFVRSSDCIKSGTLNCDYDSEFVAHRS